MSEFLKILSLRQHGIVFNNAFDGLLAGFNVGHSARIPTAITSHCVCQQAPVGISFNFVEDVHDFPDVWRHAAQSIPGSVETLKSIVCGHPILQYNLVL